MKNKNIVANGQSVFVRDRTHTFKIIDIWNFLEIEKITDTI